MDESLLLPGAAQPCNRPERPTAWPLLGSRRAKRDGARSLRPFGALIDVTA